MQPVTAVALTLLIGLSAAVFDRANPALQRSSLATLSPRQASTNDPFQRLVIHLPKPDSVTIETIPGIRRPGDTSFISQKATLVGEEALAVARVWRRLRNGIAVQCYNPGYRLTFFARGSILVEADVCFDCYKIQIKGEEGQDNITGNRKAVAELLELFQRATKKR